MGGVLISVVEVSQFWLKFLLKAHLKYKGLAFTRQSEICQAFAQMSGN
jgi:hypothetical protein